MRQLYVPRAVAIDSLKSYGAAKAKIIPGVEHRRSRYLNNRAETSHQPTRQCELRMKRCLLEDGANGKPRSCGGIEDRRLAALMPTGLPPNRGGRGNHCISMYDGRRSCFFVHP
jgi:hypothetical protein